MTNINRTDTLTRKPEMVANWLFFHFSSWRNLVGLIAIIALSLISITFNYQLGALMGSDEITKRLFPIGFAVIDIAALFLASWIHITSTSLVRKTLGWFWFAFLLSLSVWAAMSFTLANDARLAQSEAEVLKQEKKSDLKATKDQIALWQGKLAKTTKYNVLYQSKIDQLSARRDQITNDISVLNQNNPHSSLAIYYRVSDLLRNQFNYIVSPQELNAFMRMLWALALTLSPFLLTLLIAFEISPSEHETPNDDHRESFSPGENTTQTNNKGSNVKNSPFLASVSTLTPEKARNTGKSEDSTQLNQDALIKVKDWLMSQEGRVTRQQIKYRSGNLNYNSVSLIIAELEKQGWLSRMSNKQLKVNRPNFKAIS